ncbi:hypothetical protein [Yoonia sediminilitoris]|uniref:Transferrin-binding protein B C-lobe/N-lobe beta barrel domain-containing protein n=1 Tax=Yoonia sediminilitoris TaxID=1286148 RepID=A0A2T6KJY0_9RHOB|nr:hypothetical protein [Yoonia sediminilitoris]PUB16232.1 hypothetical protein C8N45_10386 [Yoonia sediminilitoris]RCW96581.1 hypothetical protein DFP92_10386 [Yoonia sediminilitoris]
MTFLKISLVLCIFGLSACGGSSTTDGAVETHELSLFALNDLYSEIETITADLESTPTSSVPTSGIASYNGPATLLEFSRVDAVFAAVGNAELVVDFTQESISGKADNFYQLSDEVVDALNQGSNISDELSMTNATAIAGELSFNPANDAVIGSVTKTSGETETYDLSTRVVEFFGPNAELVEVINADEAWANGRSTTGAALFVSAVR